MKQEPGGDAAAGSEVTLLPDGGVKIALSLLAVAPAGRCAAHCQVDIGALWGTVLYQLPSGSFGLSAGGATPSIV